MGKGWVGESRSAQPLPFTSATAMKNILVATDFSNHANQAIEKAADLAHALGAKLWLLHVAAPEPDFVGYKTGPQSVRDHLAHQLRKEHTDLQAMAARINGAGAECEALLVQGPTAETIVSEAKRLHVDLVVMGSHGHGALFRAIVGSVCEQVIGLGQCTVMVVPADR